MVALGMVVLGLVVLGLVQVPHLLFVVPPLTSVVSHSTAIGCLPIQRHMLFPIQGLSPVHSFLAQLLYL
jgi:hypothetical protein